MRIVNLRNQQIISTDLKICQTAWSRFWGMMFLVRFKYAYLFFFKKPVKVVWHMFFVFFKIDVVFMRDDVVVEYKLDFRPFHIYKQNELADVVLELESGSIKRLGLMVGDRLEVCLS